MAEYEVIVMTTVREVYVVEASSEAEALDKWSDTEPVASECQSVDEVDVKEAKP